MGTSWSRQNPLLGTVAVTLATMVAVAIGSMRRPELHLLALGPLAVVMLLQSFFFWRQQKAFRQRERLALRMLDDLADFAVVTDETGRIVHVSDRIRRFGRDPAMLVGRHWVQVTAASNLSPVTVAVEAILQRGNYGPVTINFSTDTLTPRLMEMTGVRADYGSGTLIVGLFRDVTERREMERALARMDRLAAVAHLAAGVAHNFNNIFAGIVLNAELAATRAEPAVAALTERIVVGAEQGAELCQKLLTVARGEPPALRPVDLGAVVADLVSLFQTEARRHSVDVSVDLPAPLTVCADANQLRQILLNLLFNAREAVGTNGWIRIGSTLTEEHVCIHVSNSGSPIAPDVLPLIFLPFFSTKRDDVQGTGLGLALCQSLAEGMGGRIDVRSTAEEPTTFTLVLPTRREGGEPGCAS